MSNFKVGEKVTVWDNRVHKEEKIFLYEYKDKFFCCGTEYEDNFFEWQSVSSVPWNNCKKIESESWDVEDFRKAILDNTCLRNGDDTVYLLAHKTLCNRFAFVDAKVIRYTTIQEMVKRFRNMDGSKLEKKV